jgi:hypothetical protein
MEGERRDRNHHQFRDGKINLVVKKDEMAFIHDMMHYLLRGKELIKLTPKWNISNLVILIKLIGLSFLDFLSFSITGKNRCLRRDIPIYKLVKKRKIVYNSSKIRVVYF